ncbi:hypothetical protein BCO18175_07168 [Burkholderia contaminans]|nr:hypothetical protein BCO18175_07168 [Burkholderia contaminans]
MSPARGNRRLACLAQPGAQGAARRLAKRKGLRSRLEAAGAATAARTGRSMRTGWARPEPVAQAAAHKLAIVYHWAPRAAGPGA